MKSRGTPLEEKRLKFTEYQISCFIGDFVGENSGDAVPLKAGISGRPGEVAMLEPDIDTGTVKDCLFCHVHSLDHIIGIVDQLFLKVERYTLYNYYYYTGY